MAREFDLVVCISAGLDSFTAVTALKMSNVKKVALLRVNVESPYSEKEERRTDSLYHPMFNWYPVFKVDMPGYAEVATTDDHVVLGRNAMLASIAAGLAPKIWICGTGFENNSEMFDKNERFFVDMTQALTQACKYKRPRTVVTSPFQTNRYIHAPYPKPSYKRFKSLVGNDKSEMLRFLQDLKQPWHRTISCFHPVLDRCGECSVCTKRFVYEAYAQEYYDVPVAKQFGHSKVEETYTSNPLEQPFFLESLKKMEAMEHYRDYRRYPYKRIRIYKKVAKLYGIR